MTNEEIDYVLFWLKKEKARAEFIILVLTKLEEKKGINQEHRINKLLERISVLMNEIENYENLKKKNN